MLNKGFEHPRTLKAFALIRKLVYGYLTIGVLALVAVVLLRGDPAQVNNVVWTRSVIVVLTAALLTIFAARAARGSRGMFLRLRIVSIVTPVAIAVLVALPGTLPLWMRIEQSVCGVVMIGVAVVANGRHLRELFAKNQEPDGNTAS